MNHPPKSPYTLETKFIPKIQVFKSKVKPLIVPIIDALSNEDTAALDSHFYVNGRRYINEDSLCYFLPSNPEKTSHQWCEHFFFHYIWDGNFQAPIDVDSQLNGCILDFGCGPGAWVIEMAKQYPSSSVIGFDVSDAFVNIDKPQNVEFLQYNALNEFPFTDDTFDFVHQTTLCHYIPKKKWQEHILKEIIRVTRPGKWIEISGLDFNYINGGPVANSLIKAVFEHLAPMGIDPMPSQFVKKSLEVACLKNVTHAQKTPPIGAWRGKVGEMSYQRRIRRNHAIVCLQNLQVLNQHFVASFLGAKDLITDGSQSICYFHNLLSIIISWLLKHQNTA
ncbi:hypothetical protein G9A89_014299 [Geosiphon pyriformis]|nr:hypothetical protein G9A89_014299 [Geosiphon pyriformis]